MSRLIDTRDLNNVVMKESKEYGRLATEIDNIVESMVAKTPTASTTSPGMVDREKIDDVIASSKISICACIQLGLNERAAGMREILELLEEVVRKPESEEK